MTIKSKKIRKIAVFLPVEYRGGSLNGAKNIAKMLHLGSRIHNEPVDVVFSCVANYYNMEKDFGDILELGIQVRETRWETLSLDEMKACLKYSDCHKDIQEFRETQYIYPTDNISNFHDCDFWLLISDRTTIPLAPLKPYGVLVYDYIQRYIPIIFGEFFEGAFLSTTRHAQFVLTTTPDTRNDAIEYAGIPANRVHLVPMEFNPLYFTPGPSPIKEPYFIWTTNSSWHKNHLVALEALAYYYRELDGKLDVVMTGALTKYFELDAPPNHGDSLPYVVAVREALSKNEEAKAHLHIMGELPPQLYVSVLAQAKFLWHPTLKDNGTYSVIEAACYGVPALSSDYPQMRFIDKQFELNMCFTDLTNPKKIAEQIKKMEQEHPLRSKNLPDRKSLERCSYKKLAPEYWSTIKELL